MSKTVKEQIELALDLEKFLNKVLKNLDVMQRAYTNRCADLREAGMLDEPLRKIEQECVYPTIQSINRTIDEILNRDISRVKNYIQQLIVLLSTDGGGSETSSGNTTQKPKSKAELFKEATQQIKEKMKEGSDESEGPDESERPLPPPPQSWPYNQQKMKEGSDESKGPDESERPLPPPPQSWPYNQQKRRQPKEDFLPKTSTTPHKPEDSGFETPQNTRPHLSPEQEEAIIQSMNKQR